MVVVALVIEAPSTFLGVVSGLAEVVDSMFHFENQNRVLTGP